MKSKSQVGLPCGSVEQVYACNDRCAVSWILPIFGNVTVDPFASVMFASTVQTFKSLDLA